MINSKKIQEIKDSASFLNNIKESTQNLFLKNLSRLIFKNRKKILSANSVDIQKATYANLPEAFIHRLKLDERQIDLISNKLRVLEKISSGIGTNIEIRTRRDGLQFRKVRVPVGVILIIYESRPEVTIDVAALCIKSGNAAILKGGSEALETNRILFKCVQNALEESGINKNCLYFIGTPDRKITDDLMTKNSFIDLVIARGGYNLVKYVMQKTRIPVLAHASGGARIYVDKSANLDMAIRVIINAKVTKPAACNSVDTVLIHKDIYKGFFPELKKAFKQKGIEIVEGQYEKEFLSLKVSIKAVKDIHEAIKFINKYSKKHSEAILADDKKAFDLFIKSIDCAAIFVNSSPRLHDGYEFGLGSEMGIATGKLHARGPVGLKELTTYKWIIEGEGHERR